MTDLSAFDFSLRLPLRGLSDLNPIARLARASSCESGGNYPAAHQFGISARTATTLDGKSPPSSSQRVKARVSADALPALLFFAFGRQIHRVVTGIAQRFGFFLAINLIAQIVGRRLFLLRLPIWFVLLWGAHKQALHIASRDYQPDTINVGRLGLDCIGDTATITQA